MSAAVADAATPLEKGREIVAGLVLALARYRPAEQPLRDWEDRRIIQQALFFLEETRP